MHIPYDLHVHTDYSDGSDVREMVAAAADAGLEGVGLADHCIPFEDEHGRRERYDLVETYEERRAEIAAVREEADVAVFDAAEVSYDPAHEDVIDDLIEAADFDYTIGSVHFVDPYDYTRSGAFESLSEERRRDAVERYFDVQVELVAGDRFDVVAHLDLPQRSPALRGLAEERHYERLAEAFASSRTVPEINAGRTDREYGTVHPEPRFIEYLRARGVAFTVGTDSHRPHEVGARLGRLREGGFAPDTYPV